MRSVIQRAQEWFDPSIVERQREEAEARVKAAKEEKESLALELSKFTASGIGKYLVHRLDKDKKEALKDLMASTNHGKMVEAQFKYKVADTCLGYMAKIMLDYRKGQKLEGK